MPLNARVGSGFDSALERNAVPRRLGDVSIRYDTSLLIIETERVSSAARSTGLMSVAVVGGGLALVGILESEGQVLALIGMVLFALSLWGGQWLERRDRQRRRCVLNFATYTLRLESPNPIASAPRTLMVDFENVHSVDLAQQADGAWCIVVDFLPDFGAKTHFREVIAAHIPEGQRAQMERFLTILRAAMHLAPGEAPEADDEPMDSFVP